ncbi:MAG: pirin [Chloroflexi bacterium 44-23]|nr:MAG: pirin [Chloroflexi bacterium 44-23]
MYHQSIINIKPLGFQWETNDPFLFCAHHHDDYPAGNDSFGPQASLAGRSLGQDFDAANPWRMYHGRIVPGFPAHPHRGFETITIVLNGFVDHSDSNGAAGRYGNGDVQWMTAGSGLQHAEMFPLLYQDQPNPLELFQVWLNLPAASKFAQPFFKMLWAEDIPVVTVADEAGRKTSITIIAGNLAGTHALPPAPDSWAADPANEVGIWLVQMQPEATWQLPAASQPLSRSLYFFRGDALSVAGVSIPPQHSVDLLVDLPLILKNGEEDGFFLILQGKPIDEPVSQYGPFVMNTRAEIQQAMVDYHNTQFGGWPWDRDDNVHPRSAGRFARYEDGSREEKKEADR